MSNLTPAERSYRTLWNTRPALHQCQLLYDADLVILMDRDECYGQRRSGIWSGRSTPTGDAAFHHAALESTNLVANLAAPAPSLALEAGNDIPRLADVLEPLKEGLAPTRCNLDDVVHGALLYAAAFRAS